VTWEAENGAYLAAGLEWLRGRLGLDAGPTREPFWAGPRWSSAPTRPALELLGDRFAMSRFERLVLLLACAPELDPDFLGRIAAAGRGAYPTLALALDALPEPVWEVVATNRPLRHWRMLEIHRPAGEPLITSRLQADDRIVNFVKGLNLLDERLARRLLPAGDAAAALSPSQEAAVDRALASLQVDGPPPAIQLLGRDPVVRRCVAARAALRAGLDLLELPPERIPADSADLTDLLLLWRREAQLLPLALYVDLAEQRVDDGGTAQALIEDVEGALFVGVREPWPLARRRVRLIDAARPTAAEQQALWRDLLPPATDDPVRLADEFDVNHLVIRDVALQAAHPESLWAACRAQTRPRLDALAQRVEPVAGWDDLVLGDETRALLQHLVEQVRGRPTVLREWGFGERIRRGTAITALFAGQSGTGKTLAAEVIAGDLELDLYRIDLSGVVSKYIGETERNLRRVFDAAEQGGALLFFDEADALFGKRSEVKDSHDRYANIEINYLLQRMEDYRGVAILASNRRQALDEAFLRRLRFVVTFPFPSQLEREALWARAFPSPTPTGELDVGRLASLAATGGMIRNIALNAASCAAGRGSPVTMELVLAMAGIEFRKNELPVNDADFRPPVVRA
jgi:ATPase family associated with various cellular activities (AAA)/Winged helix domain, variant